MDEITTLLTALKQEYQTYKGLIDNTKDEIKTKPFDKELNNQLSIHEQQLKELEVFIGLVTKSNDLLSSNDKFTKANLDDVQRDAYGMINDFVGNYEKFINVTFQFSNDALDIAEKIIEGLDLSGEVDKYKGIKGYVIQKIIAKAGNFIPYLEEIQMILGAIAPGAEKIKKAELDVSTAADMKKVLLYGKAESLDAATLLKLNLIEVHASIENAKISDNDKYIKFNTFYEVLKASDQKLIPSPGFFTKQVDKTLYECLQELFAKCNTTVYQTCEYTVLLTDGGALNKNALLKTQFSKKEGINKHIFDILAKMNIAVSGGIMETKVIQKVFPNTTIVFQGPKNEDPSPYNEQQNKLTQYAGNRAAMLDRDAQRRAEKKELLALRPKAEELGIDKAAIKEATLAELKQMIEDKQAQKDRKIKLEKNIKRARKYGVPENVIETLVEANASTEQFYAVISKTDKYKEHKRLQAERKKQLDDKNVDFDQGDKNKIPLSKIDLELNKLYILANHFSISSRGEHGYEKNGGILLDNFSKEIKTMAERIAPTGATHLVFRCSFAEDFHNSVVEQVCDHLTEKLRRHMKDIKGKDFEKLSYEISSIERGSGKEMVGYFILLKKQK